MDNQMTLMLESVRTYRKLTSDGNRGVDVQQHAVEEQE